MRRSWCRSAAAGLVLLAAPDAAFGNPASAAGGFGRLAIDWPEPVAVSSRYDGAVLEIEASRPFPAELAGAAAALAPLLEDARIDAGGTKLRLSPAAGVTVEAVILDGEAVRIGLAPADAPRLGLRLGRHDGFERVVLEPIERRQVQLRRAADRLELRLPGWLAPGDRGRLGRVPGVAAVAAAGDQLFVTLEPGVTVRDLFVGPDKQVLDISAQGSTEPGFVALGAARGSPQPPPAGAVPRPRPRPAPLASPTTEHLPEPPGPALAAPGATPAPLDAAAPAAVAWQPWSAPTFDALAIEATRGDRASLELRFAWPEAVPAAIFVRGGQLWVAFAATSRTIDVDSAAFASAARGLVGAVRQEPHASATLLRLRLDDAVATAVERVGGDWRVSLAGADAVAGAAQPPGPALRVQETAEGLRLPVMEAVLAVDDPAVGDRLELGLAIDPTGSLPVARRFVGLRLLPTLQGAAWQRLAAVDGLPQPAGDGIALGPADGVVRAGAGEPPPAATPPGPVGSPLAVASSVSPLSDGLPPFTSRPPTAADPPASRASAVPATGGTTAGGTAVRAPGAAEPSAPAPERPQAGGTALAPPPSPLGLARRAESAGAGFWDRRTALQQALNEAAIGERPALQRELALLYLGNGLGPEAVSVLAGVPASTAPGMAGGAAAIEHRALEGAALLLAGQPEAALERLADPVLQADAEVALWRAAARAALADWDAALVDWRNGEPALGDYPPPARAALGEHGVALLLATGQIDDAFALIEQLRPFVPSATARDRLRLLEATALERDGAIEEARAIWRPLADQGHAAARVLARRALVEADLGAGLISAGVAADRLAADSILWRGLDEETELLRRHAALRHAAGQAEAALAILQQALEREPPAAVTAAITAEMAAIVDGLFADFTAGGRSATAMLLTYRRFAELVPPGSPGDGHVASLAAALGELGLDEAAVGLLRGRLRLSDARDAGRAVLGLALARRLAAGGDPAAAIAALLDSNTLDSLEPEIAMARRALLAALARADEGPATAPPQAADLGAAGREAAGPWAGGPEGGERPLRQLRDAAREAFDRAAWSELAALAASLEDRVAATGRLAGMAAELVLLVATAGRQLADDTLVEHLAQRYGERLASPDDQAVLRLLAIRSAFTGSAAEILDEAARYVGRLRAAVRPADAA